MTATPRRRFLQWMSVVLGTVAASAAGVPILGFLFGPPARRRPERWRSVGAVDDFRVGETVEVRFPNAAPVPWAGETAVTAAWLQRKRADEFVAFALNCTHLGCPVRWVSDARLFFCPCHGGVFYEDGAVAAGPPQRALSQYPVRVDQGRVLIQTSALPL